MKLTTNRKYILIAAFVLFLIQFVFLLVSNASSNSLVADNHVHNRNLTAKDNIKSNTFENSQYKIKSQNKGQTSMYLTLQDKNLFVGRSYPLDLRIKLGDIFDASDSVIKYDPKMISIDKVEAFNSDIKLLDSTFDNKRGVLNISTMAMNPDLSGEISLARITITPLSPGKGSVSFDFKENSTSDSNVLIKGSVVDQLTKVNDLSFEIR